MPESKLQNEVLVIRGIVDRAGRFRPRRCTSTDVVRQWPRANDDRYVVELSDVHGAVLHREPAALRPRAGCDLVESHERLLTAYIALRDEASSLSLRHDDLILWRSEIPERPRLALDLGRSRVTRRTKVRLRLTHSEPRDGAYLQVIYQWGERRHLVLGAFPPSQSLDLDMATLPGGKKCRFVVQYSNGLRSAGAATRFFPLDPLGPTLTITKPEPNTRLNPGQPLELEGQVLDPERPGATRAAERLEWWVDQESVGRGPIAGIERLAPGRHQVRLRYTPERDEPTEITTSVNVTPRSDRVIPADDWPAWDDLAGK